MKIVFVLLLVALCFTQECYFFTECTGVDDDWSSFKWDCECLEYDGWSYKHNTVSGNFEQYDSLNCTGEVEEVAASGECAFYSFELYDSKPSILSCDETQSMVKGRYYSDESCSSLKYDEYYRYEMPDKDEVCVANTCTDMSDDGMVITDCCKNQQACIFCDECNFKPNDTECQMWDCSCQSFDIGETYLMYNGLQDRMEVYEDSFCTNIDFYMLEEKCYKKGQYFYGKGVESAMNNFTCEAHPLMMGISHFKLANCSDEEPIPERFSAIFFASPEAKCESILNNKDDFCIQDLEGNYEMVTECCNNVVTDEGIWIRSKEVFLVCFIVSFVLIMFI